jgi:hypothetical protein
VNLTNTITGRTSGGHLTLKQTAVGGDGGSSDTGVGGAGGAATSSLTFDDTASLSQSLGLAGETVATGGAGGAGAAGGKAGAATSTLVLTGAGTSLRATAMAIGGRGDGAAAGGVAKATVTAVGGPDVQAHAIATGGAATLKGGAATATTTTTGSGGVYSATASTKAVVGGLSLTLSASAGGGVDGGSVGKAMVAVGGAAPAIVTLGQALAIETGAPSAASAALVLNANPAIKAMFGLKPLVYGIGELGGGYSSAGAAGQSTTSEVDATLAGPALSATGHLVLGAYGGVALGGGVTGVTFDLYANGVDVLSQSFASGAAAQAWFTDRAIDLGALSTLVSGGVLALRAVMTVTSTSAGSGFYGGLVVGDPPQASGPARLAEAMAGLPAGAAAALPASPVPARAGEFSSLLAPPAGGLGRAS